MTKVSVIIPVYNSAKYLESCIDSLLGQTGVDCNFIFVNDGSTDQSEAIIRSKLSDSRVALINQANAGVSAARNAGIAAATGDYVGFVDADDTISENYYATLYDQAVAGNCDVVISGVVKEQEGYLIKSNLHFPTGRIMLGDEVKSRVIPQMVRADDLNSCVTKLYKRSFLQKYAIRFPKGIALGEDGIFNMHAMSVAERILFVDYYGYRYREVQGSASRNLAGKDYFARAVEVYQTDYNRYFPFDNQIRIDEPKAYRLLSKVVSYSLMYLQPGSGKSVGDVRAMINHHDVRRNIARYWREITQNKSKFELFILYCIKYRVPILLFLAARYSQFRNKN